MKHPIGQDTTTRFNPALHPDQIQPNAVDLVIDSVFKIESERFYLGIDSKEHRGSKLIEPTKFFAPYNWDLGWGLEPGSYEVLLKGTIQIGPGEAGWIIPRSTLIRNGVTIHSGLYDSGYDGVIGCMMNVTTDTACFEKGARVAQFLLFDSESVKLYDGSYGTGTSDDETYS